MGWWRRWVKHWRYATFQRRSWRKMKLIEFLMKRIEIETKEVVCEIITTAEDIAVRFHNDKSDVQTTLQWYEILVKMATRHGNHLFQHLMTLINHFLWIKVSAAMLLGTPFVVVWQLNIQPDSIKRKNCWVWFPPKWTRGTLITFASDFKSLSWKGTLKKLYSLSFKSVIHLSIFLFIYFNSVWIAQITRDHHQPVWRRFITSWLWAFSTSSNPFPPISCLTVYVNWWTSARRTRSRP